MLRGEGRGVLGWVHDYVTLQVKLLITLQVKKPLQVGYMYVTCNKSYM